MPTYSHQPVLESEVLRALRVKADGRYVDGTMGLGGHAAAILKASSPAGWLYGFDRDGEALEQATNRLAAFAGRFEVRQESFGAMAQWIAPESCDGVLLDLGVSSMQLDAAERGFSFLHDGPLDMRMDRRGTVTAQTLVNELSELELARIFFEWGEERQGRRLARAIVAERGKGPLTTTGQLARLVEQYSPRHGGNKHPATRVFQALRMAVNDETKSLQSGLAAACLVLKPGGRLAVIAFHSIEDRLVKQWGTDQCRPYTFPGDLDRPELRTPRNPLWKWVVKKPLVPSESEIRNNPRARSAKMRVLERV